MAPVVKGRQYHSTKVQSKLIDLLLKIFLIECVQRKLDIAGTATGMRLLLFSRSSALSEIPVAHFDQIRTLRYQF